MSRRCSAATGLMLWFVILGAGSAVLAGQDLPPLTKMTTFAEFGDPKYPANFEYFDYADPNSLKGGALKVSAYGTFERLDTIVLGPRWAAGIGLTGDTLMTGSGDELASYYPSIAESIEVSEDASIAVFNINPKARWHDGEPITADDFVFSVETIQQHGRPLLRDVWGDIETAEALDERRLLVRLRTTDNWQAVGRAATLSPLPRHYYEQTGRDITEISAEPALYEGAYRIASVDPGRSVSYERVLDYWAADLPVNRGANNFDRITYTYFRDLDVAFEAFKAGNFDYWSENQAKRWVTGYDFTAVDDGTVIRDDTVDLNSPRGFAGIVFNTRLTVFEDVRVRDALAQLFDFEWTRKNIFFGLYERARSWFPNSDYGTRDFPLPEGTELEILERYKGRIPDQIFTTAFEPSKTDGSGRIRRELRSALSLLAEAGWNLQSKKLVNDATGEQMKLEIIVQQESTIRVVQPFVKNLQRAGIDASIRRVDPAQYERLTDNYDYNMIVIGANFFPPPGEEMRTYFASSAADELGTGNWAGIKDPVVDELLDEVSSLPRRTDEDLERLKATTRALDRVLSWQHYIVPTYYAAKSRSAYWDLFGQPETRPFYGSGFPSTWWWDPSTGALQATKR